MKRMISNRNALNILMVISIILHILFSSILVFSFGIFSKFNDVIDKLNLESILKSIDGLIDGVLIFSAILSLLLILIGILILRKIENLKNTQVSNVILKLLISILFTYFTYLSLSSSIVKNFLNINFYFNILRINYMIILLFLIYYIGYNLFILFKNIKRFTLKELLQNYKVIYYPFLIIFGVTLLTNIFNAIIVNYVFTQAIHSFSLEQFINISDFISVPAIGNFFEFLEQTLNNLLDSFNINASVSLSDFGFSIDTINKIFDNFVLKNLDNMFDNFILQFVRQFIFSNFFQFIVLIFMIFLSFVIEYFSKYKYHLNLVLMIVSFGFLLPITNSTFVIYKFFTFILIVIFALYIIFVAKEENEKLFTLIEKKLKLIRG